MMRTLLFIPLILIATTIQSMETLKPIKEVKARHYEKLMAMEGVASVGVGKNESGQPSIVVGVKNETDATTLPINLEGYQVVVRLVGDIKSY